MKKALIVLVALLGADCAGYQGLYITPVAPVVILNSCRAAASLVVLSPGAQKEEVLLTIPYGKVHQVNLKDVWGASSTTRVILVRGFDVSGQYLGSQTRSFYINRYSYQELTWEVSSLQGGRGCGR